MFSSLINRGSSNTKKGQPRRYCKEKYWWIGEVCVKYVIVRKGNFIKKQHLSMDLAMLKKKFTLQLIWHLM